MQAIADSNAILRHSVLPQHQAALTLLQSRLAAPATQHLTWLDLACGRGQILGSVRQALSDDARRKLEYWAYDLDSRYARETDRTAATLGFGHYEVRVGELSDFSNVLPANMMFDYITLTNTVHEIDPGSLASLLVGCVSRLADHGGLFVYDMERIDPPELGAVPWAQAEVRRIVHCMIAALADTKYKPEVGGWVHKSTEGWNVLLEWEHIGITKADLAQRLGEAVSETDDEIKSLLNAKIDACRKSLEALTAYGAETGEEAGAKERLLYEFWALSRAVMRMT